MILVLPILLMLSRPLFTTAFSVLECNDVVWLDADNGNQPVPMDHLCNEFLGCICLPSRRPTFDTVSPTDRMMCLRPQYEGYNTPEDVDRYATQVGACNAHCSCKNRNADLRDGGLADLGDSIARIQDIQSEWDFRGEEYYLPARADCGKARCWNEADCEPVRLGTEGCEDVVCMAAPLKARGYRKQKLIEKYGVGRCKHKNRKKRGLERNACFCNSTYISEGCCGVKDGLVWEESKLGNLNL
ncbi:MAG: hypothetical protein M1814_002256 [Vezdaea aestivalis]|nr:MAG: hypothetical protein M1814_002256 [Vezdaea aestivalis]